MLRSGNHHCVLLCCGINVWFRVSCGDALWGCPVEITTMYYYVVVSMCVLVFLCFAISYIRLLFVVCVSVFGYWCVLCFLVLVIGVLCVFSFWFLVCFVFSRFCSCLLLCFLVVVLGVFVFFSCCSWCFCVV